MKFVNFILKLKEKKERKFKINSGIFIKNYIFIYKKKIVQWKYAIVFVFDPKMCQKLFEY